MADIMIDIETMGTGVDAPVMSIGAVRFSRNPAEMLRRGDPRTVCLGRDLFHVNVDLQSCIDIGMKVDARTIQWWMGQSDAARASLYSPAPIHIDSALSRLKRFIDWRNDLVWSKGPSFDITILNNASHLLGNKWGICSYVNERCVRTIYELFGVNDREPWSEGEQHDALDDAYHQALIVQKCLVEMDTLKA